MYALRCRSHGLEEGVLPLYVLPHAVNVGSVARGVYICLSGRGCYAYRRIFQHAAESAHGVSLEVCEVDHEVVVREVAAHDVVFDVALVSYRDAYVALFVHDIYSRDAVEAVAVYCLPVCLGGVAAARICGVTLYDGAVDLIDEWCDELWLQVVVSSCLAGRDFHCHTSFRLSSDGFVEAQERLR